MDSTYNDTDTPMRRKLGCISAPKGGESGLLVILKIYLALYTVGTIWYATFRNKTALVKLNNNNKFILTPGELEKLVAALGF